MDECRRRIDELDAEIVQRLNARAECALELGRLKESVGLDTYQPARERAVLDHARGREPAGRSTAMPSPGSSSGSSTRTGGSSASRNSERLDRQRRLGDGYPDGDGIEGETGSMVVVMEERASEDQIQHIIATLVEKGFDVHRSTGALRTVLGAVGGNRAFDTRLIEVMEGVQEVLAHHGALQARQSNVQAGEHRRPDGERTDRGG